MKRLAVVVLNLIFIVLGIIIICYYPLFALAITVGMLLIAVSIISFAVLIYFPPKQPEYVKLKVVETSKTPERRPKLKKKPEKRKKIKKKARKRTKR